MTATRDEIRFLLNDREERLKAVRSSDTLLDHLRLTRRLRGTKEGCAEGDCGACTVLVGRRTAATGDGGLVYEPVNACIRLMGSLDLTHVVTIEHLARDGILHPIQAAMVDLHGSQCGFCTPGFVMSLYALWMRDPTPSEGAIEEALQGNLCRCTGYRPIVDAAKAIDATPASDPLVAERARVRAALDALDDGARVDIRSGDDRVVVPASADDLAAVLAEIPAATIVAGSTDIGLWITKFMRDISPAVFTAHLTELQDVTVTAEGVRIGAGVSYDTFQSTLDAEFPHLSAYWRRIGGWQVRAMGTVGGNVANGSPIGDTPPAADRPRGHRHPAQGRRAAHGAARGVLHRLRKAGPATRRFRGGNFRADARRPAVSTPPTRSPSAATRTSRPWPPASTSSSTAARSPPRASPTAAWPRRRSGRRPSRRRSSASRGRSTP